MLRVVLAGICFLFCNLATAAGSSPWVEGTNYFRVLPPQATTTPGKIEVLEVFSYACPACNQFQPTLMRLRASLPPQAQMAYLPASFSPAEDWPVFQRAFLTARSLGVAEKSHDAMYEAIWSKGTLALLDPSTHKWLPQQKQPTIADVAKFYTAYGVKMEDFLAKANSFQIDTQMRRSDAQIRDLLVDSTPTIIVNGKYRLTPSSAGGLDQTIQLVQYLISLESRGMAN